jgi:hypothetical protein
MDPASAVTGRIYVTIGRDNKITAIEQTGPTGTPLFSKAKQIERHAPASADVRA